jgi:hypothetical protein
VLGLIGDGKAPIAAEALRELEGIANTVSETITPQEGDGMATKSASESLPMAPGLEAVRGMNEIAKTADGRIALQRWRNGQDLDPAQSRLVEYIGHMRSSTTTPPMLRSRRA